VHPAAVVLKLLLAVVLVAGDAAVGPRWRPVLAIALIAGIVGTISNIIGVPGLTA
jgi:hypothetical protein